MKTYKALFQQVFEFGNYKLVPIRFQDRFDIMKWRNEQIYHLRQKNPLTQEDQENYFNNVIEKSFNETQPKQILFSFLYDNVCIGYGGLVHINWIDQNAELSFIMDTNEEKQKFQQYWTIFLKLIEMAAFETLKFHKIFTYAFDLRQNLYSVLEMNNYKKEAILSEQCFYNGKFIDVVIHSKII